MHITTQQNFVVRTRGRGTIEVTAEVGRVVRASGVATGTCSVFVQHTSASLVLCENADPTVRRDLETILARLAGDLPVGAPPRAASAQRGGDGDGRAAGG